jgi:signal transduction histidine kinase
LLQRQAEVLSKAEQKFRSLLEAAPDAMIISSGDGEISLVNSQVEAVFGSRREELMGRNIRLLVPDWSPSTFSHVELTARRKDGSEFPVEISLSPLQTAEGLLITSAIRDITERKRNHDKIRELNATLEQKVAERTQALLESNEALRRSNDDLNQFAYAASHDLQEPLRMVSIYSELLQRKYAGEFDAEANQFLSFMIGGAQRMEQLLKDLLTYSQAGSSNEGPPYPVDCGAILQKVMLNLQVAVEQSEAVVTWDGSAVVHAHEIKLIQLFQNLIGNAIKYRSEDPPRIKVTASRQDSDWLFCVEDNGIGIKPEYCQQIFGVFRRLHGRDYPGTGIGLAICQRIIEKYGGRIWVDSTPGEGSRFNFTIPATAS